MNNIFDWKNIYINEFLHDYETFKNNRTEENYILLYKSSINLFKTFFAANGIVLDEERLIVISVLKYNVLSDGLNFYNLYKTLKNRKNKTLSKKYFHKKYTKLFNETYEFFEKRIKVEEEY